MAAAKARKMKKRNGSDEMEQFKHSAVTRWLSGLSCAGVALALSAAGLHPARADGPPLKIGVIGEASSVAGASITKAAQLAVDQINAQGGFNGQPIQLFIYDDHSSAS